jgi:hypothetical protein
MKIPLQGRKKVLNNRGNSTVTLEYRKAVTEHYVTAS